MLLAIAFLLALPTQIGPDTLSAVDLYGLRTVPETAVREAIRLRPGDPLPDSAISIRARLQAIPGVAEVDISPVCCSANGGTILYDGIREIGSPAATYRSAPTRAARLPPDIVAAGTAFDNALENAVRRGAVGEDDTRGYALARDSATRAVQGRFIHFAANQLDTLRRVLRTSADAEHRALAAQIVAYGADRKAVVRDLLYAVSDPDDAVRNNAVRALAVLASWANQHPEAQIRIPVEPFLDFLDSVSWTDRNKAVFVLVALTVSRDPALLAELRSRALPSLVEMARWTDPGHALGPFQILSRVAGLDDGEAFRAWQAGEREGVIARAMSSPR